MGHPAFNTGNDYKHWQVWGSNFKSWSFSDYQKIFQDVNYISQIHSLTGCCCDQCKTRVISKKSSTSSSDTSSHHSLTAHQGSHISRLDSSPQHNSFTNISLPPRYIRGMRWPATPSVPTSARPRHDPSSCSSVPHSPVPYSPVPYRPCAHPSTLSTWVWWDPYHEDCSSASSNKQWIPQHVQAQYWASSSIA